ncbi:DUF2270 domain-containing protein [Natrinema sp. 1APR25-10V2]|uniref:DUF2270 domain-containing protein n=1 Tax=Natrinema sp. 1APR25-10V2 TaxID=2951081 RepID=UPI002876F112|nr:DUF2270 domain-containing protein [Natrinema sp. 1APR25-10V2]MDS0474299.1 DUF2270 domain-containing protein [Natrinema sp. 1APR25-10V2]
MTEPIPEDFDSTAHEERNVATVAATDREEFLALLPHYYRGEMSQSGNLLSRLDLTTDWAIVAVTAVLALAFQGGDVSAYLLLIGIVGVSLFLLFDVRRYRVYDASRARIRLIEENVFANALEPSDAVLEAWRAELAEDLRRPTFKVSYWEAISRRLRRIYYPLYLLLGIAWLFRITLYTPKETWTQTASVPGVSGPIVVAVVAAFFLAATVVTVWPRGREAKGEFHGEKSGRWKD